MSTRSLVWWLMAVTILHVIEVVGSIANCDCRCTGPICDCTCGSLDQLTSRDSKDWSQQRNQNLQNLDTDDSSSEVYKEELIPVRQILGTKLFTGVAYRLHHVQFGKAPIISDTTPEGLEVRFKQPSGKWYKVPFRIVAERRQSQWPYFRPGGTHELRALFMFLETEQHTIVKIINLEASRYYQTSCVGVLTFNNFDTRPLELNAHENYCRKELKDGCANIIDNKDYFYKLEKSNEGKNAFLFRIVSGHGAGMYLGFDQNEGKAYMGVAKGTEILPGHFEPEIVGSHLTGTIISFKIEKTMSPNIQHATMIQSHDVTNNSSKDITQTFDVRKTITSSYTFGFSSSIKKFAKLAVMAGISLGGDSKAPSGSDSDKQSEGRSAKVKAGVELEASLAVNTANNQQWTTTTEDTFSINQVVTIPAFRSVTIDGTIEIADNVELGFVSQILVSMSTIRLTKYSRSVVKESLPQWQIKENLIKHVQGRIIQDTEDGILFETNGTVRASFGIGTVLNVKESPVNLKLAAT